MLSLDEKTKHVPLVLTDDDIALEDPEEVRLSLRVYPGSLCPNVNLIPFTSTTILIHDNDGKLNIDYSWFVLLRTIPKSLEVYLCRHDM